MSKVLIDQFQPWGRLGEIPPYTPSNLIGEGSSGVVYRWYKDGRQMAVKRIRVAANHIKKDSVASICIEDIEREIKIVSQLTHKNIIQCFGVDRDANYVFIVTDYAEGGSLKDALGLSWEDKKRIVVEVARRLAYLHKQGIIHRDIKAGNILLTKDKEAKLCDFGIAKVIASATCVCSFDRQKKKSPKGTPRFIAPELISIKPEYSTMSDVYALGVVMQDLLCGDEAPRDYLDIMERCLVKDPEKRLTVEEIVKAFHDVHRDHDMDTDNNQAKTEQTLSADEKSHLRCSLNSGVEVDTKCTDKLGQLLGYAGKGDTAAQTILGYLHLYGIGVLSDNTKAVEWLQMAANEGFAIAQSDLGRILLTGEMGVPQDHSKALDLLEAAANQGDTDACTLLGQMNLAGEYVEENDEEAMRWFRKAAEGGSTQAQYRVGQMYYSGWGVEQNYTECRKFMIMATSQELPAAYLMLGYLYRFGRGVPQDDSEAVKWWLKAAEKGDKDGQYNVGFHYIQGSGVEKKNYYKGREWLQKASEQGQEMAQSLLEAIDQGLYPN